MITATSPIAQSGQQQPVQLTVQSPTPVQNNNKGIGHRLRLLSSSGSPSPSPAKPSSSSSSSSSPSSSASQTTAAPASSSSNAAPGGVRSPTPGIERRDSQDRSRDNNRQKVAQDEAIMSAMKGFGTRVPDSAGNIAGGDKSSNKDIHNRLQKQQASKMPSPSTSNHLVPPRDLNPGGVSVVGNGSIPVRSPSTSAPSASASTSRATPSPRPDGRRSSQDKPIRERNEQQPQLSSSRRASPLPPQAGPSSCSASPLPLLSPSPVMRAPTSSSSSKGKESAAKASSLAQSPATPEDPSKQYKLLEKIGHGSFGTVYRALHIESNTMVAIKQIDLEDSDDDIMEIQAEIGHLSACDSDWVTRYYGSFVRGYKLWIGRCQVLLLHA